MLKWGCSGVSAFAALTTLLVLTASFFRPLQWRDYSQERPRWLFFDATDGQLWMFHHSVTGLDAYAEDATTYLIKPFARIIERSSKVGRPRRFRFWRSKPRSRTLVALSGKTYGITTRTTVIAFPLWASVVLFSLCPSAVLLYGRLHRYRLRRRVRHNQCLGCGYDLTGNVSGRCPECGRVIRGTGQDTAALGVVH